MKKIILKLSKKLLSTLLIFFVFMYVSVFICTLPSNYTYKKVDGKWVATYPIKSVFKSVNSTIKGLAQGEYKKTNTGKDTIELLKKSVSKSVKLLGGSLILAMGIGLFKGIFDSRRGKSKDSSLKVLLTLIPISLPDVLIVAMLQAFAIWLIKHGITIFKVAGSGTWHHEVLPILSLSILPACYIARVTAMSIESCYEMEYVKAALGKGCSSRRILWNHVMRNAVGIIFESLSNITAMIIGNLLIVEFMFNYPGIANSLITSLAYSDRNVFIVTIFVIGIIYFVMDAAFKLLKNVGYRPLKEDSL